MIENKTVIHYHFYELNKKNSNISEIYTEIWEEKNIIYFSGRSHLNFWVDLNISEIDEFIDSGKFYNYSMVNGWSGNSVDYSIVAFMGYKTNEEILKVFENYLEEEGR